ncbi:putative virulence-associated protein [Roseibium sp. TrichSKD4]|uniref:DUF4815 domain-containing protein n=1 Tax=Roseibium sp. TrichSKD4 TaxID=744980 RepID=UPI0001E56C9D|nr:DUF4815 domain-containing protein [Roseibium sp. TrichSKD4]EFO33213.1 putative virulence-associated protein [Roseibium sp. TrichSKD4]
MVNLPDKYINDFDPKKNRTGLLETEDTYYFGADANVARSMLEHRIRSIGDGMFSDGDKMEGCTVTINKETGAAIAESGKIYYFGMGRDIEEAELQIPAEGKLQIGAILERRIITHLEDVSLKFNDQSFESHNKPRCPQWEEKLRWGLSTEGMISTNEIEYRFVPIYEVEDRVILDTSPPPEFSGINDLLGRYDYESNSHYVVWGCKVSLLSSAADILALSVEEGTANVKGKKIDRDTAKRLEYASDPDLETIRAEPHYFNDGGTGSLKITLNRTPIAEILDVSVLEEKTADVHRSQIIGGRDPLPDAQVARIVSVVQGETTFEVGTDYQLIGDEVDWGAQGSEPATGSTYQVTYTYKRSIDPDLQDDTSVTISGAVTGSQVDIDYRWKMPRIDLITLDKDGRLERIKGTARAYSPVTPNAPTVKLVLAELHHDWIEGPDVRNVAVRTVSMQDREYIRDQTIANRNEIARMQLILDANIANGYAKSEIFADNFDDDSRRDQGVDQGLAIVNGVLTLPISASLVEGFTANETLFNEVTFETILEQRLKTGQMRVNPYQAADPVPVRVSLNPAMDQWTSTTSRWHSAITQRLADWTRTIGRGFRAAVSTSVNVNTRTEMFTRSTVADERLRSRDVVYEVNGYGPNEPLALIEFDGISLALPDPAPKADANGRLVGSFRIPEGLTAGAKSVRFVSKTGNEGFATYVGRGSITINEMRAVTTVQRVITRRLFDPLGYIWTPPKGFYLGSVSVLVEEVGDETRPVILQIRNVQSAQPTGPALAEVEMDMRGVKKGDILEFVLPVPLWMEAFEQKAHIWLTNDDRHALAIAELGKFDPDKGWVTRQPNLNMVMISSSNNTAYVHHHSMDLWTIIKEAKPVATTRTVELGTVPAGAATDLLALAGVETPVAGTEVELIFERENGGELKSAPGQVISLSEVLDEELTVKAVLKGTQEATPILFPNIQIVLGKLVETERYVSRAFTCGNDMTVEITTLERTPGNSSFVVAVRDSDGVFQLTDLHAQEEHGEGWFKRTYRLAGVTTETTAIQITATGSALHRPAMAYCHASPLKI